MAESGAMGVEGGQTMVEAAFVLPLTPFCTIPAHAALKTACSTRTRACCGCVLCMVRRIRISTTASSGWSA